MIYDSGSVIYDSGSVIYDSWSVIYESGSVTYESGWVIYESGSVIYESGSVIYDSRWVAALVARRARLGPRRLHFPHVHNYPYRGTSLIRHNPSLGPYRRLMPRALWWS